MSAVAIETFNYEDAPYENAQHALARAFSRPSREPSFAKPLDFSSRSIDSLTFAEKQVQQGMTRRALENVLSTESLALIYACYCQALTERLAGTAALVDRLQQQPELVDARRRFTSIVVQHWARLSDGIDYGFWTRHLDLSTRTLYRQKRIVTEYLEGWKDVMIREAETELFRLHMIKYPIIKGLTV